MKVLLVEDSEEFGSTATELFEDLGMTVVWAKTLSEAKSLLNPGLDLVVWDGLLGKSTSVELIHQTHTWFKGDMVACATVPGVRIEQMAAGCNYSCDKKDLPKLLLELLGQKTRSA